MHGQQSVTYCRYTCEQVTIEMSEMDLVVANGWGLTPIVGKGMNLHYQSDHSAGYEDSVDDTENLIGKISESYRGDMISDINSGLTVLSTSIRVISAILTLFGASNSRR